MNDRTEWFSREWKKVVVFSNKLHIIITNIYAQNPPLKIFYDGIGKEGREGVEWVGGEYLLNTVPTPLLILKSCVLTEHSEISLVASLWLILQQRIGSHTSIPS